MLFGIILWILCSLNWLIYQCNFISAENTYKKFLCGHQRRLPFWAGTNLSSTSARAKRRCEFCKISKSQSEADCSSIHWERRILLRADGSSVLHQVCQLVGTGMLSQGQWEPWASWRTFKLRKKQAASSAVVGTRAQWERPMWLPCRSQTGMKMEGQCEGCLDALQERRDAHTEGCEQEEQWRFANAIPPPPHRDRKTSNGRQAVCRCLWALKWQGAQKCICYFKGRLSVKTTQ